MKQQIYSDIYDDAEWLTAVVENLLSITRIHDGRLKFKFTDQLLGIFFFLKTIFFI